MRNKLGIKDFVTAGIFAAITLAVSFVLGAGIIFATGIPATGGIANIFAAVLIVFIGLNIVPKFGFATLTVGIMFALAIPTVIGGSIGIYKLLDGILIGLVFDSVTWLGRYRPTFQIIAGALGAMVSILSIYVVMLVLGLPDVDKLQPLLVYLVPLQGVNGALGAWCGYTVFKKRLEKISAIRNLSR